MSLCVHVGGKNVSKDSVFSVPTPERTASHVPVAHHAFLEEVTRGFQALGYTLTKEKYALARNGNRMFGVMDFTDPAMPDGMGIAVGLRNAHDKSMSLGVCAGTRVFVCDNLAFSGDVVCYRKHTAKIDVNVVVKDALAGVISQSIAEAMWMSRLKEVEFTLERSKAILVDAYRKKACNQRQLNKLMDRIYGDQGMDLGTYKTGWCVYQSFTDVYKGDAPGHILKQCRALNSVFADHVLPRHKEIAHAQAV